MPLSIETQQLMDASHEVLKKSFSQEEINSIAYFVEVASGKANNLSNEEKASLETFFENAVNNQDLNKKVSKAMKSMPQELAVTSQALGFVRNFCYKTRFMDNIDGINKKTVRNLELLESGQTVETSEKMNLSEIGMLTDTLKSQDIINLLSSSNIITPGGKLDGVRSTISSTKEVLQRLNKKIDSGMGVQSGDMYFTHTQSQNALMNRDPKSFFEKAKNHVTKYQHAATLYKRDDETLLGTYNTYINQVEDYINYAKDLNNLHMQEFARLDNSGYMTQEIANAIKKFSSLENMTAIVALSDQIEKYAKIAQGEAVTPKDFENILKDMQPLVDSALRLNNGKRQTEFFGAVISNVPGLSDDVREQVFYNMAVQTGNLSVGREFLLQDLYNLNNVTTTLDKPRVSHINAEYERYDLSTQEALMSKQYRIDPIKLIESLETKIALQEKLGHDWEHQIRNQFTKIATKIHGNTNFQITNDMDRMISAGLADYGLASDIGDAEPKVGLKGKVAGSVADRVNTGMGDIKFGNKGHKTDKVEENKFEKLRDRMLGLNGEEASKNMLCSEFAAKATLTAFVELNDWIEKETGVKKALNTPIENKEVLNRVHPQRLLELMESSGCVTEVKNPILEQLVNTNNYKKNYHVKENATELLYDRIKTLASETRDDQDKFVKDASVIFKAYMKAENPEHGRSDQEINDMLKPALIDLHETYKTRNPESFMQKLQQFVVKVKEFCGKKFGYEYKTVKSGVKNILDSAPEEKGSEKVTQSTPKESKVTVVSTVKEPKKETAVEKYVTNRGGHVKSSSKGAKKQTAEEKYVTSRSSSSSQRGR